MISIYEYKDRHRDDIIRMILNIQQNEFDLPITEKDQPDLGDIKSFYMQNNGIFLVAVDGMSVIGTVALKNIGSGDTALRKMFVKSEYRGKELGVSIKLLSQLFDWARQSDYKRVFLGTTPQFLAAHRFYEKNGFKEIAKEELPKSFPVMEVDKKFYCYIL